MCQDGLNNVLLGHTLNFLFGKNVIHVKDYLQQVKEERPPFTEPPKLGYAIKLEYCGYNIVPPIQRNVNACEAKLGVQIPKITATSSDLFCDLQMKS